MNPTIATVQMPENTERTQEPATEATAETAVKAAVQPVLGKLLAENPLLAVLGAVTAVLSSISVAALIFGFTTTNSRIDDTNQRIDRLEVRMDRLEDRMNRLEDKMDARFEAIDARFDILEKNMTALIAALGKTDEVEAAVEGRLLSSHEVPAKPNKDPGVVLVTIATDHVQLVEQSQTAVDKLTNHDPKFRST